jgi:hypothetical protein
VLDELGIDWRTLAVLGALAVLLVDFVRSARKRAAGRSLTPAVWARLALLYPPRFALAFWTMIASLSVLAVFFGWLAFLVSALVAGAAGRTPVPWDWPRPMFSAKLVAVDQAGTIFVGFDEQVQVYDADGRYLGVRLMPPEPPYPENPRPRTGKGHPPAWSRHLVVDDRGEPQLTWARPAEVPPCTDAAGRTYAVTVWSGMPCVERRGDGPDLHVFGPWWLRPIGFPVPLLPLIAAIGLTFAALVGGWLPLDAKLIKAAAEGKVAAVQKLLPLKSTTRWSMVTGKSALGEAAAAGHSEVVRLLTAVGDRLERRDDFGRTALIRAAEGGHAEAVRVLLDAGARTDAVDRMGWDAFQAAVENGHARVAELIRSYHRA